MKYKVTHRAGVYMLTRKNRLVSGASIANAFGEILAQVILNEPTVTLELDAAAVEALQKEINGK